MPKIEVEMRYCKGCGYCIQVCPKKVLHIGKTKNQNGQYSTEQFSDECIACKMCAIICPDSAITVYK